VQDTPRVAGRHFLQIPGPSPVPDRILHAISMPTIDHRGPEFQRLGQKVLGGLQDVFRCSGPVVIYPASGTGAWEAALVNTLSPGDRVVMVETGHFAALWATMARNIGLEPALIPTDWRRGAEAGAIEAVLREDRDQTIRAVCVVHNETSTGCVTDIPAVRRAIDAAGHPALLMVDTISSLGSIDYRHDEWGVDVSIGGSQKGLMLPPGLSFNALSRKAIAANEAAGMSRSFWSWKDMAGPNSKGFFPYTPSTNLLFGLSEALDMLAEEGRERVFARHARHATAVRAAVRTWGLEIICQEVEDYSGTLTGILMPEGHDADAFRARTLAGFDLSLGTGLGKFAGKAFRIGHLGDTNDLTVVATLAGVEMGLHLAGVPHRPGGVREAMEYLADTAKDAGGQA